MPLESEAAQRRDAVRQRCAIHPRIARRYYSQFAYRPVRLGIIDLSATGVSVRSLDELQVDDLLELIFDLAPSPFGRGPGVRENEIHVHARVQRVVRNDRVWDAGCAFEGTTERQRDRIVKFVFAQQRMSLRTRRDESQ